MNVLIKRLIQQVIPEKSDLYFNLWLKYYWKPVPGTIEWHLDEFSKEHKEITFIQVGSNDGFLGDPIYKYIRRDRWKGILIEPVDYLFKKLKKNYASINDDGRLKFEQVAISSEQGFKDFYFVKDFEPNKKMPVYLNQQGSFNREHLIKVKEEFPQVEIMTKAVPCETVSSILSKHRANRVDLIHIDTEGHDYTILKSINFEKLQPKMVLFEHRHMSEEQRILAAQMLKAKGYEVVEDEFDTLGMLSVKQLVHS